MIDLLQSFEVFVGFVIGLLVAILFHWFAPTGADTISAGAWFIGLGCLAGLLWSFLRRGHRK
ncbi:MAG: hypothetical protein RIS44_122 [Pseudomonadota bacterium]|jgi:hypothetical protein